MKGIAAAMSMSVLVASAATVAAPARVAPALHDRTLEILTTSIGIRSVVGTAEVVKYAEYLRSVLLDAGYSRDDIRIDPVGEFVTFTARYPGRDPGKKPLLLIGHLDVVEARREGKWMHYSLASGLDDKTRLLLHELFNWMEDQDALRNDTKRYEATGHPTHFQAFLPLSIDPVETLPEPPKTKTRKPRAARKLVEVEYSKPVAELYEEPEPERNGYVSPRHNELEDFLL